jgi:potassium-transporting ATPase KdpC subunit
MKGLTVVEELGRAAMATLILAVLLCGIYPLVVWGVAQVAFPHQANGSLIEYHGQVVGSRLIGQPFSDRRYFHPRPSAAGSGYDAARSGGSNLGPLSRQLFDQIRERIESYRLENNLGPEVPVPADAVTASGSGLDPDISVRNAELQAARVARARGLSQEELHNLIRQYIDGPSLAFLGEPGVNVLKLNLALEEQSKGSAGTRMPGKNPDLLYSDTKALP